MHPTPYIHVPHTSPQAQDLGQRIAATVRTYLAENPGIGAAEVSQAFMVARQLLRRELGGVSARAVAVVVAAMLGVLVFGLAATLYLNGGPSFRIPIVTIGIFIVAIAAMVLVIARRGA